VPDLDVRILRNPDTESLTKQSHTSILPIFLTWLWHIMCISIIITTTTTTTNCHELDLCRPLAPWILYTCTLWVKLDTDCEIQHQYKYNPCFGKNFFRSLQLYSRLLPQSSRHFACQHSARVSQALRPYFSVIVYNFGYYLRRPIVVISSLCSNTLVYAHMTSRTFHTYDNSLGSLTVPVSHAGHIVKLILLWLENRAKICCLQLFSLQKSVAWKKKKTVHVATLVVSVLYHVTRPELAEMWTAMAGPTHTLHTPHIVAHRYSD